MISREGKSPEEKIRMKRPRMKGNNEMLNLCAKISVTVKPIQFFRSWIDLFYYAQHLRQWQDSLWVENPYLVILHIYVSDVKCNHLCMQNLSIKISIDQGVRDARWCKVLSLLWTRNYWTTSIHLLLGHWNYVENARAKMKVRGNLRGLYIISNL